jgi:hypothetical protein
MKKQGTRLAIFILVTFVLATIASTAAFAQSDAQRAFEKLKTLTGTWEGTGPDGKTTQITYRVTSGGSALLSEISPDDAMITMFHLDGDRLMMTHYCGAGNQPRMKGTLSPDGKTVAFEFVDATNLASPNAGHMNRAAFSMPDASHHSEEWTFLANGKEETHRFELHRVATASAAAPDGMKAKEEHKH